MQQTKKLLSLALALVMTLSLATVDASAGLVENNLNIPAGVTHSVTRNETWEKVTVQKGGYLILTTGNLTAESLTIDGVVANYKTIEANNLKIDRNASIGNISSTSKITATTGAEINSDKINGDGVLSITAPANKVTIAAGVDKDKLKSVADAATAAKIDSAGTTTPTTYTVTKAATSNGSFTVSPTAAAAGTTVTVTATPNSGYELDSISTYPSLSLSGSGGTRTFTMPASSVTVYVTFKQTAAPTPTGETVEESIYRQLRSKSPVVDVSKYGLEANGASQIYWDVINNNPDLFYVELNYDGWDTDRRNGVWYVNSFTPGYKSAYSDSDIANFYSTCDAIVAQLTPSMTNVQKLLFLHDYLVTHCEYDQTYSHYAAYDAIVGGAAVCQGYSLAYMYLAGLAGFDAQLVSSEALNHAWDLVYVDGAYYYVDCTWDDPLNDAEFYCGHGNFLRSRSGITATGHGSTDWVLSDGTNAYSTIAASGKYDDYFWSDVNAALPMVGGYYAYAKKSDNSHVYLRSASSGAETAVPVGQKMTWPAGGNGYWIGCFSIVAGGNGMFYFNTPTEIYSLSTAGTIQKVYTLTNDERSAGYIYGLMADGNDLYYYLGQDPNNGSAYTRKMISVSELAPMP